MNPCLAITQGDPAGIGPEVIAAAWPSGEIHALCRPVVVGHPEALRRAVRLRGVAVEVVPVTTADQAKPSPRLMPCLPVGADDLLEAPQGAVDARAGEAAYQALLRAIELAQTFQVDAIVTAPLGKAALWAAGHRYPGHTEILAERCGVRDYAMMLYLRPGPGVNGPVGLGVIHVTLHVGLAEVPRLLSTKAIEEKIELARQAFLRLGAARPRIGVCALNPHAGEAGLFGDEEARVIAPAVERARRRGVEAAGPLPADSLLRKASQGEFDAVVAMYHDQGHIALKLLGMHRAVNVTLGLPIVRTSVAHGTAFDIAGQGVAEWSSMLEAIRVAAQLCGERSDANAARRPEQAGDRTQSGLPNEETQ